MENVNKFLHELQESITGFLKHLGHDISIVITHHAKEVSDDVKEHAEQAVKEAETVITDEIRQWARVEWSKHCETPDSTPFTDEWALAMWEHRDK